MKNLLSVLIFMISFSIYSKAQDGEKLFKVNCSACHALGQKLVGPDLIGIHGRRNEEWLLKWIKSSQTVIKSGDEYAVKLFNDYNKVQMPDQVINEGEIKSILAYLKSKTEEYNANGGKLLPAADSNATQTMTSNEKAVNQMTFTEYLLIFICFFLLVVVWTLVRTVRSLSNQAIEKEAK